MKDFVKGEKWQDLDVTTWPVVEHFQERVQTDGYVKHLNFTCTNSTKIALAHAHRYSYTSKWFLYIGLSIYM
jgi:hypothetical protein